MALFDFLKDVGEKLFPGRAARAEQQSQKGTAGGQQGGKSQPWNPEMIRQANQDSADAIRKYIKDQKLDVAGLNVAFDSASSTVTLSGTAPDQATREKIVLASGNIQGVARVDDRMTVEKSSAQSRFYTVKSGDTLSQISKDHYGDANKYDRIFQANRPMLKDPDKIYPGQVLRIPAE